MKHAPIYRNPILVLCAGLVLIISIILIIKYFFYEEHKTISLEIQLAELFITILGFVGIVCSILIAHKSAIQDAKNETINLYKEFRSDNFNRIRYEGWKLRFRWYNELGFKEKFDTEIFDMPGKNDETEELSKSLMLMYDLHEFFRLISLYQGDRNVFFGLNCFYYPYWRGFLYETALSIDNHVNKKIPFELKQKTQQYVATSSYLVPLKRLDVLCGFENISPSDEFYGKGW